MKNYVDFESDMAGTSRLRVKVFVGKANQIEDDIQKFIDSAPILIEKTMQSESDGPDGFAVTITIFYYEAGFPQFVRERLTVRAFRDKVIDSLEKEFDISFLDVWEEITKRSVA